MPESHNEDVRLAALTAVGDISAYGELVRRYQSAVLGILIQLTRHRAVAEDIAQDSFVRGFTRISQYNGSGSFRSWICAVAYREWLMYRRQNRYDHQSLDPNDNIQDADNMDTATSLIDQMDLQQALNCLPSDDRELLVLNYVAEFSHADIASLTELPLGTIKSRIKRSREKLKSLLGGVHNDRYR